MSLFQNHYTCYKCHHQWQDDYECMVDDTCPECGARNCSPVESYQYPQYGDRYKCTACNEVTTLLAMSPPIIECPYCGSKNLDLIAPDGTVKSSQRGGEAPVTLRLTLTVTYDPKGTATLDLKRKLAEIVAHATGEGAFTGNTTAEVENIGSEIEDITKRLCKKCGSPLQNNGECPDATCPYSDRQQSDTYTEG